MRVWWNWQTRKIQLTSPRCKLFSFASHRLEDAASSNKITAKIKYAPVAELADAIDSDSIRGNSVQVQVLSGAPNYKNPNQILPIGDRFGFLLVFFSSA